MSDVKLFQCWIWFSCFDHQCPPSPNSRRCFFHGANFLGMFDVEWVFGVLLQHKAFCFGVEVSLQRSSRRWGFTLKTPGHVCRSAAAASPNRHTRYGRGCCAWLMSDWHVGGRRGSCRVGDPCVCVCVCVGGPLGGVCPRHLSSPRVVKTTLPSEAWEQRDARTHKLNPCIRCSTGCLWADK